VTDRGATTSMGPIFCREGRGVLLAAVALLCSSMWMNRQVVWTVLPSPISSASMQPLTRMSSGWSLANADALGDGDALALLKP